MTNFSTDTFGKAEHALTNTVDRSDRQIEKISRKTGESLGEAALSLVKSTTEYVDSGRRYVVGNPIKGVAIAAATGVVAGTIFTLAMRRH